MSPNPLIIFFVLFGGAFSITLSLGQLTLKNRNANNYIVSVLFLCIGFSQVMDGLVYLELSRGLFFKIHLLSIALFYLMGPLLYFYFSLIIGERITFDKSFFYHFITAAVSLVLFAPFIAGIVDNETDFYLHNSIQGNWHDALLYAVTYGSNIVLMPYILIALYKLLRLHATLRPEKKRIVYPCIVLASFILLLSPAWVFDKTMDLHIEGYINLSITVFVVAIYVLSNRYPEYLQILKLESLKTRYSRSNIQGLDVELILCRINELMEREKIFCDEDINLKRLADEVGVSTYQLSEILNERLNKSFYNYINEKRIGEAQQILLQEPERSILSVAHAVGFNNLSAFYAAYRKFTGMTPGIFRRKNAQL